MKEDRISIISFSLTGGKLAEKIASVLSGQERTVEIFCLKKYADHLGQRAALPDLKTWCGDEWNRSSTIIFIGASGIAVRTIAPYVKSKVTDPAVLVLDEGGHFVISLLSGHLGGANEEAARIASAIHAVPVITTATDVHGMFAVDVWAKENDLIIDSMKMAKEISSAVLQNIPVYLYCPGAKIDGMVPRELTLMNDISSLRDHMDQDTRSLVIWVDPFIPQDIAERRILRLIPHNIVLGIGCRRDQSYENVLRMTSQTLVEYQLDSRSVCRICSIDLKKDEPGIHQLAENMNVSFDTFSADELRDVPGEFTPSRFVNSITGVENVCERSAVAGSSNGSLIIRKTAGGGVTVAAAQNNWRIYF